MRMSEEQFDEVIATNLKSVFNTTKGALKNVFESEEKVQLLMLDQLLV